MIRRGMCGSHIAVRHALNPACGGLQGRHKAQLRGSARVLCSLAGGLPASLQGLAAMPAKRTLLLVMLPTLRQRHRFHLQVPPGTPPSSPISFS